MLEAIKYEDGILSILDQHQLPQKTHYQNISSVNEAWVAIKEMKVRGAPAIAIVAALSLAVELRKKFFVSKNNFHAYVNENMEYLVTSRPTAINLRKVCDFIISQSEDFKNAKDMTVEKACESLITEIELLLKNDITINKLIGEFGGKHICELCGDTDLSILTHCNTGTLATAGYGTALGVIRYLFQFNCLKEVFYTETRPYNQGSRLTAYELLHDEIPSTLICDSMVASLMKNKKISAVIVGADRVVQNGDTANKIGTYQIAICAKYHKIPFYVACPRSSLDFSLENGSLIPLEERSPDEMTTINSVPIAPPGINCWNPSFDVTPAELITGGIITECGVFSPSSLKANIKLFAFFPPK